MKQFQNFALLAILVGLALGVMWRHQENWRTLSVSFDSEAESKQFAAPEAVEFCGERIPIRESEVRQRFKKEMDRLTRWKRSTRGLFLRANYWFPRMKEILKEAGVPEDFVYVVAVESGMDNVVSSAGAAGFWQMMRPAALEHGLRVDEQVDERFDPIKATRAAARYFKQAHEDLDSWTLAAASYNRGIYGIQRAMKRQGAESYYDLRLNRETAAYVYRILAFKKVYEAAEEYGLETSGAVSGLPEYERTLKVKEDLGDLRAFAEEQNVSLKQVRTLNPWLVGEALSVPEGGAYWLKMPASHEQGASELPVGGSPSDSLRAETVALEVAVAQG